MYVFRWTFVAWLRHIVIFYFVVEYPVTISRLRFSVTGRRSLLLSSSFPVSSFQVHSTSTTMWSRTRIGCSIRQTPLGHGKDSFDGIRFDGFSKKASQVVG